MLAKFNVLNGKSSGRDQFYPLPFLGNPHVQTVLAHLSPRPRFAFPARLRTVRLPDGDLLAVHDSIPTGWRNGDGVVLLVHGLGGCHRSGYMLRLAIRFLRQRLRVLRLDLRGVGAGATLARMTYHAGCSGDLRAVALDLHRESPDSLLVLVGMSLGGNLVLKLAGEAGDDSIPGLHAVAAVAPPIDMTVCSAMLARSRFYDTYFARQLVKQVRQHQRHFPEVTLPRFPRRPTMRQFDDLCTAPRWGFAGALDYYRRASALPLLANVKVPAFILTARDDPFIAVEPFESLTVRPNMEIHIAEHGGHLGFLGSDGAGGFRWAESQVAAWVVRQLAAFLKAAPTRAGWSSLESGY
jgi:predicted alpha/beta-fold hydrolase